MGSWKALGSRVAVCVAFVAATAASFVAAPGCSSGQSDELGTKDPVVEESGSVSSGLSEVPPNGGVTTISGLAGVKGSTNSTTGWTNARFDDPAGVAIGPDGTIYVADWNNNSIRRIKSGGVVDNFANGSRNLVQNPRFEDATPPAPVPPPLWTVESGSWGLGGQGSSFGPFDGFKYAIGSGTLSQTITLTSSDVNDVATGLAHARFGILAHEMVNSHARVTITYLNSSNVPVGTPYDSDLVRAPNNKAFWAQYFGDSSLPQTTRKIKISLIGTSATVGFDSVQLHLLMPQSTTLNARITGPSGVGVDASGNVYVASMDGQLRGATGGTLVNLTNEFESSSSVFVGPNLSVFTIDTISPPLLRARRGTASFLFNVGGSVDHEPVAVAAQEIGTTGYKLAVAYRDDYRIRFFSCTRETGSPPSSSCSPTSQLGAQLNSFSSIDDIDGTAGDERFFGVRGLGLGRVSVSGGFPDIFVSDATKIRRILEPYTLTAAGQSSAGTTDGPSTTVAKFSAPGGLAVAADGSVIIADRTSHTIRKISCASVNVCAVGGGSCPVASIDDGNLCTTDSCAAVVIRHDNNSAACNDGNACTLSDVCSLGVCTGTPKNIDDHTACTNDSCNPATGAVSNVANWQPDTDPCTDDVCDAVTGLVTRPPKAFSDSNTEDCMIPVCNPANGNAQIVIAPEGYTCGATGSGRTCNHAAICEAAAPVLAAPSVNTTVRTPFGDATGYIYEGPGAVQTGVTPGYIDKLHPSWLVGYVKTAAGTPMPNVLVTIPGKPGYGQTLTRMDGRFDLVVNGGTTHNVRFAKDGHFPADRRIYAGWDQTVAMADVILLTPDLSNGKAVTPGSSAQQVAVGSTITGTGDDAGTRTAVVVIPGSTDVVVDGVKRTTPFTLRLTEYTTGADGMKRMPAPLAPATGYTYAVEISADEALAANRIDFTQTDPTDPTKIGPPKDVFVYIDDFIGFASTLPTCISQCAGVAGCINACRSVPTGYYDRSKLEWVPSKSGRIIKIKSVTSGIAAVDVTGDDLADSVLTDSQFAELGFTSAELATLGERYAVGKNLWRVPINHMTPWDCNWPNLPPDCSANGACPTPPPPPAGPPDSPCGGCCGASGQAGNDNQKPGSIIGCDSQTLGEKADVPGTPFSLHYSSRRMPGFATGRQTIVPLTGSTVHPDAKLITVTVGVAGRRYERTFVPDAPGTPFAPNLTWTFDLWDGMDAGGHAVVGAANATIIATTYYKAKYTPSAIFGDYPSVSAALTSNPRSVYPMSSTRVVPLMGTLPDQAWSLGGWTFDQHHSYDPTTNALWMGNGNVRLAAAAVPTIKRIYGGITNSSGHEGALAVGPNGDIFVADYSKHVVKRIDKSGVVTTVVGDGIDACSAAGPNDNVTDATTAHLSYPRSIAVGPDGSLYITGKEYTIRKATPKPDGKYAITTIAGISCFGAPTGGSGIGNGGPATSARLANPQALAVAPDGTVYVGELFLVRKIDRSGIISTIAGNGSGGLTGGDRSNEGKLASTVSVGEIEDYDIAVAPDGTLLISQSYALTGVDQNGRIHYLNGTFKSNQSVAEGVLLKNQSIGLEFRTLAARSDGSVVFNDNDWQGAHPGRGARDWVRLVDTSGVVRSIAASNDASSATRDSGLAMVDGPRTPLSLAAAPDGSTVVLSEGGIYRIELPKSDASRCNDSNALYLVANGDEDFCFDRTGRHLKTIDSRTARTIYRFEYTGDALSGIFDRDGQKTSINKLAGPARYEVVAPFKQKTTIALHDTSGYATSIGDSLGGLTLFPLANGLLDKLNDRRSNLFDFTFDPASGLLTADASPLGAQTLSRSLLTNGRIVTYKTPLLRETKYETIVDSAGVLRHTTTFPDLSTEIKESLPSGVERRTAPDGTITESALTLDARFNSTTLVAGKTTVKLPSSLTKTTQQVTFAPTTLAGLTGGKSEEFRVLYGASSSAPYRKITREYSTTTTALPGTTDAFQRVVEESPEGRKTTRLLDAAGRLISSQVGSLTPTVYAYEETAANEHFGSLKTVSQGGRSTGFEYRDKAGSAAPDDAGYIVRSNGPYSSTEFSRDLYGRVLNQVEAKDSGATVEGTTVVEWDANGNLRSVQPPSAGSSPPLHVLGYNAVNLLNSYKPPTLPGIFDPKTTYAINNDRDISSETRSKELSTSAPVTVTRTYINSPVNTGQLDTVSFPALGTSYPAGNLNYDYFSVTNMSGSAAGRVSRLEGPYDVDLAFRYNGSLLTETTWSGDVVGSVSLTHNDKFLRLTETVSPGATDAGPASYTFGYDNDQLLTCVSGATSNACNPATAADLVIARSPNHGLITDISVGKAGPPAVTTVTEHWDYSDTSGDLPTEAFGELRKQTFTAGSTTASITYDAATERRDDLGRIRVKTETFAGTTKIEYFYDERGRLEEVVTGSLTETFGYDLNGNRTGYSTRPDGVFEKFGVYDAQDRLQTYGTAGGTSVGDLSFTYGPNGELKTKAVKTATGTDTWTYGYDPLGNLVTVSKPGTTVTTYTYLVDGLGRRVGKKQKLGTAAETVTKRWLYRGGLSPVAELDSSGAIVARYVYGSRGNVPDLIIKGGNTYRLFVDQLGSPRMAVNVADTADVPYRVDYSAFGVAMPIGSTMLDWIPFGFAGGLVDKDTGLVRFGLRDYDPHVGRWLSKDAVLFWGGQANLYAYVDNDPVNFIDPVGAMKLPADPSQLPPDWVPDTGHKDPNGTRYRHGSGDYLDFHRGREGMPGWRGRDHWHRNGDDEHLRPGDNIPDPPELCRDSPEPPPFTEPYNPIQDMVDQFIRDIGLPLLPLFPWPAPSPAPAFSPAFQPG